MSVNRSSAFAKSGPSGSALVALILTLTLAVIVVLTVVIGVALSESVPITAPSTPPADHGASTPDVPASVTVLNTHEVEGILGHDVVSTANENMGHIVDVIVDRGGKVRAAIID